MIPEISKSAFDEVLCELVKEFDRPLNVRVRGQGLRLTKDNLKKCWPTEKDNLEKE